jgi:hypothetical protein
MAGLEESGWKGGRVRKAATSGVKKKGGQAGGRGGAAGGGNAAEVGRGVALEGMVGPSGRQGDVSDRGRMRLAALGCTGDGDMEGARREFVLVGRPQTSG